LNRKIWGLVGVIFAARLVLALLLPLSPQEAYYWNYSRHLALSYFDHPPLAAWSIWLFTHLLGDTVFAIRLPAFLYSVGTFVVLYQFTRRLAPVAVREFLPLLLSPFFFVGGIQMLPDSPLLFFYAAALFFGYRAAVEGDEKRWYGFGVAAGMALLSKYSAVLIFGGMGLYILFTNNWKILCSPHFWFSILPAGALFSPVLIWNAGHHWASFLFQSSRRAGELSFPNFYNFGRYLVTQILVVSPVLWLTNWKAFIVGIKVCFREKDRLILYLTSWILPFFVIFSLVSFFYWVKLNWLWPGYLVATALVLVLIIQGRMKSWFKSELVGATATTSILVLLLFYQPFAVHWSGNSLAGWRELAQKIVWMAGQRGGEWEIAGYEYKAASELAFYLPNQPETYSNTLIGEPGLQYDYWFDQSKVIGRNFLFVIDRRYRLNDAPEVLKGFFEKVEEADSLAVKSGRGEVTTFYIYPCYSYKGLNLKQ